MVETIIVGIKNEDDVSMLMHRYLEEAEEKPTKKKTGTVDYSKEADSALYRDEDGTIYVPNTWVEQSMVKAASSFQIPGQGKKTYKDLINSAIIVRPEKIPIVPQDYVVDKRSVRIGKSRVFRYRPRFDKWALKFEINILDDQLQSEVVKEILCHAGAYKGIGDYRPKFGRYRVEEFKAEA